MSLPTSSKVIIVGGGIVGCSTAYHLAKIGHEVLLLEKASLTSGSTWHAAGLVGQLRSNANITQLLGHSINLYDQLEPETGLATGWKMNGGRQRTEKDLLPWQGKRGGSGKMVPIGFPRPPVFK